MLQGAAGVHPAPAGEHWQKTQELGHLYLRVGEMDMLSPPTRRQGVPQHPRQPGMVYMSRVGMLKHLRSLFMPYRSAQFLSLSSGFSQSFFLPFHHAAPAWFAIKEERWDIVFISLSSIPPCWGQSWSRSARWVQPRPAVWTTGFSSERQRGGRK